MDHTIASETFAAERYLLGEMALEERDEFEEHFFCCRVCGEEVQTASVFVENAKAVFRDESLKTFPASTMAWFKRDWLAWLRLPVTVPAFAALVLAAVVSYQNAVVIPALRMPQSMASPVILDGETRSELPKKQTGQPLRFEMVLFNAAESDRVQVEISDAAGTTVRTGSLAAPGANQPLDVYFPGRLKAGRYTLVARSERGGNAGQELARNQFEILPKGE